MIDLVPLTATPDGRGSLVPPPGVERRLKRGGQTRFAYPENSTPAGGPVVILHRATGIVEVRVARVRNQRLTGRVGDLFATGSVSLSDAVDLAALGSELAAQWAAPTGTHRWRVAASDVAALRATPPAPTAAWLGDYLASRVVGQPEAVRALAGTAARHLRKRSPVAPCSALLIGPTGVGKTESVLQLVAALEESEPGRGWNSFVVDGGEITGEDQLNRVLGAAPGYIGYDQGSPLANTLASGPAVLLFDEIEKAHPALLNRVLLGLLDRGRVTVPNPERGQARLLDARESIVLFTSNLGVDELPPGLEEDALRNHLRRHGLRPELVGRLGDVIQFSALDDQALVEAACLAVNAVLNEYDLLPRAIAPAFVASCLDSFDARSGVRGVRAVIERRLQRDLERLVDTGFRGAVEVGDPEQLLRAVSD